MSEALEQCVLAMFGYITDLSRVDIDPTRTDTFEVKGEENQANERRAQRLKMAK